MVEVFELTRAEDVKHIMPLLKEFFQQTRQADFVELNEEAVTALATSLIKSETGVVLVAVEGGEVIGTTAGMLYPLWFSPDHMTGQEMFWYVAEHKRRSKAGKRMFNALEQWAQSAGADSFAMIALSHLHENRIGKMYQSKGYVPMERSYIKEF